MRWYVDTSALVKLLIGEAESAALTRFLGSSEVSSLVSSQLLATELGRFAQSMDVPDNEVDEVLRSVSLVLPSASTFDVARRLPGSLRSLDALHLATALEIAPDIAGVLGYDRHLLAAAADNGFQVVSPGAS